MGIIINPRGVAGSGKTEFVRQILAEYGWKRSSSAVPAQFQKLRKPGRALPIAYRALHPNAGRPLVVLGHYERTCGGCDTISQKDGGLDEVVRLAHRFASTGHDVLLEGLCLSAEFERTSELAKAHPMVVMQLKTSPGTSAKNLAKRRRLSRSRLSALIRKAELQEHEVRRACSKLEPYARVYQLEFTEAVTRAWQLLGLTETEEADLESSLAQSV